MKKLSNLKGVKTLTKSEQKALNGGMPFNGLCPKGCFPPPFLQGVGSSLCAIRGANGNVCFGTIQNGQCCM